MHHRPDLRSVHPVNCTREVFVEWHLPNQSRGTPHPHHTPTPSPQTNPEPLTPPETPTPPSMRPTAPSSAPTGGGGGPVANRSAPVADGSARAAAKENVGAAPTMLPSARRRNRSDAVVLGAPRVVLGPAAADPQQSRSRTLSAAAPQPASAPASGREAVSDHARGKLSGGAAAAVNGSKQLSGRRLRRHPSALRVVHGVVTG